MIAVLIISVDSAPITVIKGKINVHKIRWNKVLNILFYLHLGTPFLFNKFDYPVDPNRGAQLSPSFQAANGPLGANLVAYFGTGKL